MEIGGLMVFLYILKFLGNSQVTDDNIWDGNVYIETFQRWLDRKLIITEFVVEINK